MNTPVTCFTALISIAEEEQCDELESYLRSKGSEIVTSSDTDLLVRLQAIIRECSTVFNQKDIYQHEMEGFFYSVVSLVHMVSFENAKQVLESLCTKIVENGTPENAEWRLKMLGLMFCHFSAKDPLRYTMLCHRIKLACKTGLTGCIMLDVDQLRRWMELWQIDTSQKQQLFLLLWDAYKKSDKKRLCVRLLRELVQTYTEANASEASGYAEALIVHIVSDPSSFVFDDLLDLPAVKALMGQKIHDLLKVFVYDHLSAFEAFYSQNKEFIDGLGLDYVSCVIKMRQLTLSSMAEDKETIPLASLGDELKLSQENLEDFIIDCVRLKLLEARINQVKQTLVIMTSIHRTFGKGQWQLIHDRLTLWKESIQSLKSNLKTIKSRPP